MIRQALVSVSLLATFAGPAYAADLMTADEIRERMTAGVDHISNDDLISRMEANENLVLIDVRTEAEYEAGHIAGAQSVPRGVVEFRIGSLAPDADQEIIVTCSHGIRAAAVTKILQGIGYTNVSAHRGVTSWVEAGQTVENRMGTLQYVPSADEED